MRILVTGGTGQLGRALRRRAEGHTIYAADRAQLDVSAPESIDRIREAAPDAVVNAAAMTDVDACEEDPDAAFRVNALGARNVAVGASLAGAPVIQISTDYVFGGDKSSPYWEFDAPSPLNVYGASKLAGEDMTRAVHREHFIVRTAWLFAHDGRNFVTRILDLAKERPYLEVVDHEVGSPTYCDDLADALIKLLDTRAYGVVHLVNEGWCSRRTFARAILDRAGLGDYPIRPVDHFPRPARPPSYAPLRNYVGAEAGVSLPSWESALDRFFERQALVRA